MTRPAIKTRPAGVTGGQQAVRSLVRFLLGSVAVLFLLFAGIAATKGLGTPKVIAIELAVALAFGAAAYLMGRHS